MEHEFLLGAGFLCEGRVPEISLQGENVLDHVDQVLALSAAEVICNGHFGTTLAEQTHEMTANERCSTRHQNAYSLESSWCLGGAGQWSVPIRGSWFHLHPRVQAMPQRSRTATRVRASLCPLSQQVQL